MVERAVLAIVIAVAGCARAIPPPQFPGGVEVPLVEGSGNSVVIPVFVDGHVLRFIVDSGASISALTPAAAATLGVRTTGTAIVNDVPAPTAVLGVLVIDTAVHRDVRVAVVDLPAARRMDVTYDGILGLDVLGRYDVVIDFVERKLALHPVGHIAKTRGARDMARVTFQPSRHGLVVMTADLEFVSIPAVLDLGAQYTLVNKAACAMGGGYIGTTTRASHLHIGNADLGTFKMLVGDLPIFARSGLSPGPAIVIGADVFARRTVVLAYQERAVYVSRGESRSVK